MSKEEEEDLENLLADGDDDFITQEERRKRDAERRRMERKRRLERVVAEEPPPPPPPVVVQQQQQVKTKKEEQENSAATTATAVKLEADESKKGKDDEDDGFDMFSSSISPVVDTTTNNNKATTATTTDNTKGTQQDWDDSEGYYKAVIGEIITVASSNAANDNTAAPSSSSEGGGGDISFRVSGVIGKGVFSSVLKCTTISNSTSIMVPPVVAIKCIRHNETMAKTAYLEIQYLQRLNNSPGIVPLLLPTTNSTSSSSGSAQHHHTAATALEHKGHVLLVFPCADYNLRDVLQKFGKGVGLSLEAVRSYFGQLLAAATHLKKHSIIHSDLKPDNILVSRDFSMVQLGDFGSAIDVSGSSSGTQPTPYLVSRFYRAPEIILGLVPTFAIDLWSLAVSVAEIFLGDVVFTGKDNNSMILSHMQHIGPFSNRLIRQHLVQCSKMPIPPHFTQRKDGGTGSDYLFTQHTTDPVTGKPVNKYVSLAAAATNGGATSSGGGNNSGVFPSTPLSKRILKAKSAKDSRTMVLRFSDLLQKCLTLDPSRRISLKDSLQHDFFTKPIPGKTSGGDK